MDTEIQRELYAYMAKILYDECSSPAKIIGGVEDHVHILLNLARTCTIAHLVEMVKKRSSKWIKTKGARYHTFQWQTGYGAFSVSTLALDIVTTYIANQREHHRESSFKDEIRGFLNRYKMEYDEKYVWD